MTKKELENELMKYSKEEIIQGIVGNFWGNEYPHILYTCWHKRHERLFAEMEKVSQEEQQALADLVDFEKTLATKYGSGSGIPLAKVSNEEATKWVKLQDRWKNKNKASEKANKALDNFYIDYKIRDKEGRIDDGRNEKI